MANSTDLAYERDNFILLFLDSECGAGICENPSEQDIEEYDEALMEYGCLLQNAIDLGDKREIKRLRSEIQHCKAEKRRIKRMIDANKIETEIAYT